MLAYIKILIKKILNYYGLQIINKNQSIAELSNKDKVLLDLVSKYSMSPKIRIFSLLQSLRYVKEKKIEGDFVECGVWRGGNLMLFKKFLDNEYKEKNINIYAYDTFDGMTKPEEIDYDLNTKKIAKDILKIDTQKKSNMWGVCNLKDVKNNLLKNCSNIDNFKFIEGKVEETLNKKENLPEKISILRLDTDWYKSTKKELNTLYEKVSPGGVIIIDDYGHWSGSKKAVDEFFKNKFVWMHYIDYACRLIIKDIN